MIFSACTAYLHAFPTSDLPSSQRQRPYRTVNAISEMVSWNHLAHSCKAEYMWCFITELPVLLRIPFHHVCIFYSTSHICSFSCVMVSILLCRSNLATQCFLAKGVCGWMVQSPKLKRLYSSTTGLRENISVMDGLEQMKKVDNITEAFAGLIIKSVGVLLAAKSKHLLVRAKMMLIT